MTALDQVATLDCTRPCPICDHHLDLIGIETVPWARHTSGERLLFQCANCGVSRTEWNTLPIVSGPEIVPETGAGLGHPESEHIAATLPSRRTIDR